MHFFAFYWTDYGSIRFFIPENMQKDTLFMFLSYVVTKIWRTRNTSVEHGICPIAEFTSPWLNCAHSNRIPTEIWRFLILIFEDGGRRHFGFLKFQFFNGRNGQEGRTASACQILSKSVEPRPRYGYFQLFKMATAAILDLASLLKTLKGDKMSPGRFLLYMY